MLRRYRALRYFWFALAPGGVEFAGAHRPAMSLAPDLVETLLTSPPAEALVRTQFGRS